MHVLAWQPAQSPAVRVLSDPFATSIIDGVMSDKRKLTYAFFSNLRVPMILRRKLSMILDNNWRKVKRLRGCCGVYGQPGC